MPITNLATPGVYVQEISAFPPSVAQVATAVPAFVGYTQSDNSGALNLKPTRIESLLDYQSLFGTAQQEESISVVVTDDKSNPISAVATLGTVSVYNLYYAMQLYFANGGGPCYIVSVGTQTSGGTIDAASGGALAKGIAALESYDEPTIILVPEGCNASSASDYYTNVIGPAIDLCARLQDRFTLVDVFYDAAKNTHDNIVTDFRTDFAKTDSLNYAAAYYPYLATSVGYNYDNKNAAITVTVNTKDSTGNPATISSNLGDTALATIYYNAAVNAINALGVTLPPSAAIAGIYALTDATRGVWKAPANVSVSMVRGVTDTITDTDNGDMNIDPTAGKSVNAIRAFTGKGILVWGARTLDGNSNDFRYIPVRRLYISVEESVRKACAAFVFEPNDGNTWVKVRAMIENYLTNLWRDGALVGAKPEQAFYVKVGLGVTMTQDDVLNGRMIVQIGMAPARPAEFIILQFTQIQQQA